MSQESAAEAARLVLAVAVALLIGGTAGFYFGQESAWKVAEARAWRVWVGGSCTGAEIAWRQLAEVLTGVSSESELDTQDRLEDLAYQGSNPEVDPVAIEESLDLATISAVWQTVSGDTPKRVAAALIRHLERDPEVQGVEWVKPENWILRPGAVQDQLCSPFWGVELFPDEIRP